MFLKASELEKYFGVLPQQIVLNGKKLRRMGCWGDFKLRCDYGTTSACFSRSISVLWEDNAGRCLGWCLRQLALSAWHCFAAVAELRWKKCQNSHGKLCVSACWTHRGAQAGAGPGWDTWDQGLLVWQLKLKHLGDLFYQSWVLAGTDGPNSRQS